jgi:hypothetical protein
LTSQAHSGDDAISISLGCRLGLPKEEATSMKWMAVILLAALILIPAVLLAVFASTWYLLLIFLLIVLPFVFIRPPKRS